MNGIAERKEKAKRRASAFLGDLDSVQMIVVGESWRDWTAFRVCEELLQEVAAPIGPGVSTLIPMAHRFVLSSANAAMAMGDDTGDRDFNNRGTQNVTIAVRALTHALNQIWHIKSITGMWSCVCDLP